MATGNGQPEQFAMRHLVAGFSTLTSRPENLTGKINISLRLSELNTHGYPPPLIDHACARERTISTYSYTSAGIHNLSSPAVFGI